MSKTIARHTRVDAEHWRCIESLANERRTTPNQPLVELAAEAFDNGEWPRSSLEIQILRSCPFTAQATARDMIAAGRKEGFDEICRNISQILPEMPGKATKSTTPLAGSSEIANVGTGGNSRGEA